MVFEQFSLRKLCKISVCNIFNVRCFRRFEWLLLKWTDLTIIRAFSFLALCLVFSNMSLSQNVQESLVAPECLYISEIMYNPTGDDNLLEFVEICNACNYSIPLNNVSLSGVSYTFSNNSILGANDFVIVSKSCFNNGDFCSQHPELLDSVFCCFNGVLTNTFKTINLSYNSVVFDSFSYTANSKENYSAQRFSNKTEFSLPHGTPGECFFSEEPKDFLEQNNESVINDTNYTNGNIGNNISVTVNITNDMNQTKNDSEINQTYEEYISNMTNSSTHDVFTDTIDIGENITSEKITNDSTVNQTDFSNQTNNFNQTDNPNLNNTDAQDNASDQNHISNQTNQTNQTNGDSIHSDGENQISQSCFDAKILIFAPFIINDSSTSYTLTLNAPNECNYYYEYEVLDFCGSIIRALRESTSFGKKSFTPSSDCCAYQINAYLYENNERILVSNSTFYMIKPSGCEKKRETSHSIGLFESDENLNFGFYIDEPLSAEEQIEKISFSIKVKRLSSKTLQSFLKGTLNVTSDYAYFNADFDKDILCKNFPGVSSVFLSGKVNKENFEKELEIDCPNELEVLEGSTIGSDKANKSESGKNLSNTTNSKINTIDDILKSIFQIKSFYTLKKNFSDNISLFFNTDFNESNLGNIYGYIIEEPFKINPGKNEIIFPFKKGVGTLYLLAFNESAVFGIKELNYSFEGFDSKKLNSDNKTLNEDEGLESLDSYSKLSAFLAESKKELKDNNVTIGNKINSFGLINIENSTSKYSVTDNIVSNSKLKPNDILLSILGIGTFSGLSFGLYKFTKK